MILFDTIRLVIRTAAEKDAQFLYALWTNPRVMKNVGYPQGLRISQEEILQSIQQQDPASEYDKYLLVNRRSDGEKIGECKLGSPDGKGVAHTDVKLWPAFWGHKYGLELKQGLVDYLFEHTDCTAVEATPNVDNIASIKMQEAVGGVRIGQGVFTFPESMQSYTTPVPHYIYRLFRADWERGR